MDHVSKPVRSKIMASVRSKGNRTTEITLGKVFWTAGFRGYRKHLAVQGRPDFAWPHLKVAIFVDGCFWHGCRCKYLPRTNKRFWQDKITANQRRDRRVSRKLRYEGWSVIRIKECAVLRASTVRRIAKVLRSRLGMLERNRSVSWPAGKAAIGKKPGEFVLPTVTLI